MVLESIGIEQARRLVDDALAEAQLQAVNIAVMVVDVNGNLVAFARMDDVGYMAIDVTRRKAITACNFKMPTQALTKIAEFDPVVASDLTKNPEVCMVPGGLPLMVGKTCVGGIGVAGGRSNQDQSIAEKAVASLST